MAKYSYNVQGKQCKVTRKPSPPISLMALQSGYTLFLFLHEAHRGRRVRYEFRIGTLGKDGDGTHLNAQSDPRISGVVQAGCRGIVGNR